MLIFEFLERCVRYKDTILGSDGNEFKPCFEQKAPKSLKSDLYAKFPELTKADYDDILFKLESGAEDTPETNLDLYVFKNGVLDKRVGTTIETDELADMGFPEYDYLDKTEERNTNGLRQCHHGVLPGRPFVPSGVRHGGGSERHFGSRRSRHGRGRHRRGEENGREVTRSTNDAEDSND